MSIYPNARRFVRARDSQCRQFLPGQSGADGLICGDPTMPGSSYCAHHHRENFQPLDERPMRERGFDRNVEDTPGNDHEPDLTEMFE